MQTELRIVKAEPCLGAFDAIRPGNGSGLCYRSSLQRSALGTRKVMYV